eukprot:TRINITY_DN5668_c0_g1_i1.p1 TRINITY_DN5668_c0_g1~~TRINITY_DN5668_c0_g1_i1.p1  ORF type:complete len:759 (+),score=215.38 TRINITY_DN5668_c0_g1_i1:177-2279(+)
MLRSLVGSEMCIRDRRKELHNPRILVCSDMLQFRQADVLEMDLHKQLEAEQNYARNVARKIGGMNPDVVITKEATRMLLDEMIKMKIVVITGLTDAEILRVAHAVSATPVTMTHMGEKSNTTGTCEKFEVKTYREGMSLSTASAPSTYCFLVGCSPSKISTVILRGKPLKELMVAKQALKSTVRMIHDLSVEASLAANLCWPKALSLLPSTPDSSMNSPDLPEIEFMYSSYCSTECQLQQHKPIAWHPKKLVMYDDDAALPPLLEPKSVDLNREVATEHEQVRDMTLGAFLIECYNSAKSSRRAEVCAAEEQCLQKAGRETISTTAHSVKMIRIMNHVLKISVIKHQYPVEVLGDDIRILASSLPETEEQLRMMEASRSISLGKFLWLVFFDSSLQLQAKHLLREYNSSFIYQDAKISCEYFDLPIHRLSNISPSYFPTGSSAWNSATSCSPQVPTSSPVMAPSEEYLPEAEVVEGTMSAQPDEPLAVSNEPPDSQHNSLNSLPAEDNNAGSSDPELLSESITSMTQSQSHLRLPLCQAIVHALRSPEHKGYVQRHSTMVYSSSEMYSPASTAEDSHQELAELTERLDDKHEEVLSQGLSVEVQEEEVSIFLPCQFGYFRAKDIGPEQVVEEAMMDAVPIQNSGGKKGCLLYTSDAADEEDSVDLGGRRIIKKKKNKTIKINIDEKKKKNIKKYIIKKSK